MFWRFAHFLLWQSIAGGLGWWQGGPWGAWAGALIAAGAGHAIGLWRASKVLRWLRTGDPSATRPVGGLWGEAADRTRRLLRQSRAHVDETEARLREVLAALQAAPNGVVLLDAQGRIEWCNQPAAALFGFDIRRDLMQFIGNLVRDPGFSTYWAAHDFTHDVILEGRDSTPAHPIRLSVQIFPYDGGRMMLLARDVTALEQAEAMRRDFVANVSHEMRTPLTVLAGFIETLQTLPLDAEEQNRYLALMARQARRMQNVVEDLLTLSRLEGSPLPTLNDWTPVEDILRRCEEEARALSAVLTQDTQRPHTLRFPEPEALKEAGEIAGEASELQSALSNLISNAVRYTPAGGSITVEWLPQGDGTAVFSVRDTGVGIAPEHVPRITERFYRVDRSRSRESGGTGLGLAIVKHVLQRHGASLNIISAVGKGSTFSVTFPANRLRRATPP